MINPFINLIIIVNIKPHIIIIKYLVITRLKNFKLLEEKQHLQFYTHACVEIKIHACPFICCVDTNTLNVNKEIRVQYNSSYEKTTFSEV